MYCNLPNFLQPIPCGLKIKMHELHLPKRPNNNELLQQTTPIYHARPNLLLQVFP